MMVLHVASCSRIYTASPMEQGFEDDEDMRAHRVDQYFSALYWAVATISSVGYGDLISNNLATRILSCLWMFAGVLVIIFSGAKLTQWLVVTDPFALAEIDKKRKLHALMSNNQIPWNVQKSALLVYPVILETSSRDYNNIIDELPQVLQDQIRLHVKLKLISKVPIFHEVSRDCLIAVAEVTVPEMYELGSDIVEYGEIGAEMFFLEHGLVEVYTYNDLGQELWMANLKGGSFFGEISLLSNDCKRTATVRAVTQCVVYALAKESFDLVVDMYPELIERVDAHAKERLHGLRNCSTLGNWMRLVRLARLTLPREDDSKGLRLWRRGCLAVHLQRRQSVMATPRCESIANSECGSCESRASSPFAKPRDKRESKQVGRASPLCCTMDAEPVVEGPLSSASSPYAQPYAGTILEGMRLARPRQRASCGDAPVSMNTNAKAPSLSCPSPAASKNP
eukprot:TRINITY_DN4893_c0_g1_i4.p2 TRINITY_DN4893_c0_g1~~TRINITY_DN4893_c0_g1_i4.p2  ORF type:complete len:453 (+),score=75.69 TRINITY_DN4893_c0_g1_i4:1883-3241(+)